MYSYRTSIVNFAPINPTQCELDKTIKNEVEVVLASVNQRPQGISKELDKKTEEKQTGLQVEKKSLYTQKKGLLGDMGDMRKDLHDELCLKIQVEIQTTNILVEFTWCILETRLAEVYD
jgi:hypothetical protein